MNVVQIFPGKSRHFFWRRLWYWRIVASNGQVVASSEGYATKWNAKRAATKLYPALQIKEVSS